MFRRCSFFIPAFIIKYHPSWIKLREQTGFLDEFKEENEILCDNDKEVKTYKEWMSDNFLSLGEREYYPEKIDPNLPVQKSVFDFIVRPEYEEVDKDEIYKYFHRDTNAFLYVLHWKRIIDGKDDNGGISLKGIRYKLDQESHFPLLVTGSNNGKKFFDFRKPRAILGFKKQLAQKNKKNKELREEVKKLEKVFRGY